MPWRWHQAAWARARARAGAGAATAARGIEADALGEGAPERDSLALAPGVDASAFGPFARGPGMGRRGLALGVARPGLGTAVRGSPSTSAALRTLVGSPSSSNDGGAIAVDCRAGRRTVGARSDADDLRASADGDGGTGGFERGS